MTVDLTKEEIELLLNALAQVPLGRSYNLFTKLLAYTQPQPTEE